MSFPTYAHYKDSGVEWLGAVPAHWGLKPLKHLVDFRSGGTPDKTNREFWDGEVPWASAKDLKTDELFDTIDHITEAAVSAGAASLVEPGSILVVVRGMILARLFPVVTARVPMAINQDLKALSVKPHIHPDFMAWMLRGSEAETLSRLDEAGHGTKALRMEAWGAMRLPVPDLSEQVRIVDFLKVETAKLDALITEQRTLIDLLKEKRQAVISHAVTKGLDPRVPMKDSGVEWLGEVPAHWEVHPLKHVAAFRSGGTPDKGNIDYWDGDIPWASAKDLKVDDLFDTTDHITEAAVLSGAASLVPAKSILVVVRGMILARIFPVVMTQVPMAINQDLKAVIPGEHIHADYMAWLLRGSESETLSRLDEAGHGTKALRMDAWGAMKMPVPSVDEQKEIVTFINQETHRFDVLTAEAETTIALLQERRSALISAAVTGKIDVRGT